MLGEKTWELGTVYGVTGVRDVWVTSLRVAGVRGDECTGLRVDGITGVQDVWVTVVRVAGNGCIR